MALTRPDAGERPAPARRRRLPGGFAATVASGILLSRLMGLVRQRVLAHHLGLSAAADAFNAAFRIPNFLQNLFGEGVLSASFIPVYARLLAEGRREEASRLAGAIVGLLALLTAVLVLGGVVGTPWLIDLIAPGFEGEKRELTIRLVRILFPGAALLVLSAWCLGVLNSHRKFFLSYTAPIVWNLSIIAALVHFGSRLGSFDLAVAAAWGSVIGSGLQVLVQVPSVWMLLRGIRPAVSTRSKNVRAVIRNFGPIFVGRGVVQISAYVDTLLASLLPGGAVAALINAQVLNTLPVSLFGMSVSAAELPAMSGALGDERAVATQLRARLDNGLRRIAFFVVPSAVAFLAVGDVITAALFQGGRFTAADSRYVWGILAGSAVGLLASTLGRLYASTYYALQDTRTPLRFAVVRVALTTVLGWLLAIPGPSLLGIEPRWGAAGLTISAGIAGWVEFALLRRALNARIGRTGLASAYLGRLWLAAVLGAATAWAIKVEAAALPPIPLAVVTLAPYGAVYLGGCALLGAASVPAMLRRFRFAT